MSQKNCKVCERLLWDDPPFCTSCWEKNFTDEKLEKSDQVWVIRSNKDLYVYAKKAKDAPLYTYALIEGDLSQQVSKAFNARAKLAGKWKSQVSKGAVAISKAAAVGLATVVANKALPRQNGVKLPQWTKNIQDNAPLFTATTTLAADVATLSDHGENEYKALPFASECDLMFKANFRLVRNAYDYVILRREKTQAEKAIDFKDSVEYTLKSTAEEVGDGVETNLKGTADDIKSVAEDIGNVVKKGWNWFNSL
ncbi:hypothetical protein [Nostoc sp. GT001]|uniref:hypothetical protein n=1 Tax=Nostoc sp. GT001 TaxID=3056647 RepID=UPI0025AAD544|nr:hypothetical protein [Nostoc sp. GT001]MDM9584357.1 hypothetical protein [Nostoc sp. GT001]